MDTKININAIPDTIARESNTIKNIKNVTYDELSSLIESKSLRGGQQYRITDYVTTTTQENTRSAGHPFDIIVTADDESTLNEVARACLHEGDTYFTEAGANLAAWQIWYCFDNDTTRFAWAMSESDIYVVIDNMQIDDDNIAPLVGSVIKLEPYEDYDQDGNPQDYYIDGRLITHEYRSVDDLAYYYDGHYLYSEGERTVCEAIEMKPKGVIYHMIDEWNNDCPYDFKNIQFKRGIYADGNGIAKEEGDEDYYVFCYTFSWETEDDTIIMDTSIFGNNGYLINDENGIVGVHDNTIKLYIDYIGDIETPSTARQFLNNIVFLDTFGYDGGWFFGCYGNSFGINCHDYNFGNRCWSNSFDNNCHNNSFGNDCYDNSFGSNCYSNIFGNVCYHNSFGDEFIHNSFGDEFIHNSFGNFCHHNSFGNSCSYNSFGNNCHHISFGNYCDYNSFGNCCDYNSFRISTNETSALKDYIQYNHFDDGCSYNVIWNSDTTSSKILLKNINVNRGVSGNYYNHNFINIDTLHADYEIQVAKNMAGEIKVYCEADLA